MKFVNSRIELQSPLTFARASIKGKAGTYRGIKMVFSTAPVAFTNHQHLLTYRGIKYTEGIERQLSDSYKAIQQHLLTYRGVTYMKDKKRSL